MVHKVGALYQFGKNPPTTKKKADKQLRAAFDNGYVPKGGK